MSFTVHPRLLHLTSLSPEQRREREKPVVMVSLEDEAYPLVTSGLCRAHHHANSRARFWQCWRRSCQRTWHTQCIGRLMAEQALAFGCPACGSGWKIGSHPSDPLKAVHHGPAHRHDYCYHQETTGVWICMYETGGVVCRRRFVSERTLRMHHRLEHMLLFRVNH